MLNLDAVDPKYPIPDWLYDGQEVYASFDGKTVVCCKVLQAFGDAAWLMNEKEGCEQLVSRWHLRIKRQALK
jgi:hypothetical protein